MYYIFYLTSIQFMTAFYSQPLLYTYLRREDRNAKEYTKSFQHRNYDVIFLFVEYRNDTNCWGRVYGAPATTR